VVLQGCQSRGGKQLCRELVAENILFMQLGLNISNHDLRCNVASGTAWGAWALVMA
jgi:hypothetical protein